MSSSAIELALSYGLKYGPTIGKAVLALLNKADPTQADVDSIFDQVKTYESFGIPDKAPTAPVAVASDTGTAPASPS